MPVLSSHNIADTGKMAAEAGVILKVFRIITVIVGEFVPCLDPTDGGYPDPSPDIFGFAIGLAGMVDKSGRIPWDIPVNVLPGGGLKNIDRPGVSPFALFNLFFRPALGFGLADALSDILDDAGAARDITGGKNSFPVNGGIADKKPGRFSD